MIEKPKIQYIGQFYVVGSEARKLDPKKFFRIPKTRLPLFRLKPAEVRYVEPVAIVSIVLAVALVLTMAFGMLQIRKDWQEYEQMSSHLAGLRQKNAELKRQYRAAYDLTAVESKALGMGMVPADSVKHMAVAVTPAIREEIPQMRWEQKVILFWTNLWE